MMPRSVLVAAPSRLHFGMFSFGQPAARQFGGVGAMIRNPGLQLRVTPAEHFETIGPLAERAREVALHVTRQLTGEWAPRCRLQILSAPREHIGLGVGTQLSLSVAAALNAFYGNDRLPPRQLAMLAGRAERSAIGTYGFDIGGLLLEGGKLPEETISPLVAHVPLPDDWRFVLVTARKQQGISGVEERTAFGKLPPVPAETTDRLVTLAAEELVPAADAADFLRFSAALYQFGHIAGLCFSACQHGAYASDRATRLVETLRNTGVQGVGQSSWGPTLFALTADEATARKLVQLLEGLPDAAEADLVVAAPNNHGVIIETE